jgi:ubiquinol-cytochrome c reductase cytochrome b subunit
MARARSRRRPGRHRLLKTFDAKFWGVVVMGGAVVILFFLPWLDRSPVKSIRYRPTGTSGCTASSWSSSSCWATWASSRRRTSAPGRAGRHLFYFGFFLLMPWWSQIGEFKAVPDRVTFQPH